MIRDLNLNDLLVLENSAEFEIPRLDSPLFCVKKSIMYDNELIGSFFVHLTSETSIILNKNISRFEKARAIKDIFDHLNSELVKLGLKDNHVFIKGNDNYSKILKKHFGFEDVIGIPLVLRKAE